MLDFMSNILRDLKYANICILKLDMRFCLPLYNFGLLHKGL